MISYGISYDISYWISYVISFHEFLLNFKWSFIGNDHEFFIRMSFQLRRKFYRTWIIWKLIWDMKAKQITRDWGINIR